MRRLWVMFLVTWLAVGLTLLTAGYIDTIYKLETAIGYLSRAQSTAFAEDMKSYIEEALRLIPESGNPVWIFPTERTDFTLIRSDLTSIVERLEIISGINLDSPAYAQGLSDIRGKLAVVILQLGEAMPYTLITPINITLALIWLSIPYTTYRITTLINSRRNRHNLTEQDEN